MGHVLTENLNHYSLVLNETGIGIKSGKDMPCIHKFKDSEVCLRTMQWQT